MKNSTKLALGAMGGLFAMATGAHADSVTATASVRINQRPLAITETASLSFGTVTPTGGNDTVTLDPSSGDGNTVSTTSDNGSVTQSGGLNGKFTITGQPLTSLGITVPSSISLAHAGAPSLPVTLTNSASGTPAVGTDGTYVFFVGGTLTIDNTSHASGTYSATYNVDAVYQ